MANPLKTKVQPVFFIFLKKKQQICEAYISQGLRTFALKKKITLIFAE